LAGVIGKSQLNRRIHPAPTPLTQLSDTVERNIDDKPLRKSARSAGKKRKVSRRRQSFSASVPGRLSESNIGDKPLRKSARSAGKKSVATTLKLHSKRPRRLPERKMVEKPLRKSARSAGKNVPQISQIFAEWVAVLDNWKSWRDPRE